MGVSPVVPMFGVTALLEKLIETVTVSSEDTCAEHGHARLRL